MDVRNAKRVLRRHSEQVRSEIPPELRTEASLVACRHLESGALWGPEAPSLALYAPMGTEADPSSLVAGATRCAFPAVTSDRLTFRWCRPDALVPQGPWAIREPPEQAPEAQLAEVDLVVVPGLAFTRAGARLGYGKGYYDRALMGARRKPQSPLFIGFGFEAQVVADLPLEPHDQCLDGLVTEAGLLRFV